MPYRLDLPAPDDHAFDRLVELGALDVEACAGDSLAALMPDSVTPEQVAAALGVERISVSPAVERDAGSVWILSSRAARVGRLQILPAHADAQPGSLRLADASAFGTGLHPTTALCLEELQEVLAGSTPDAVLDVGTGSGVLALAALTLGVRQACGIDIDDEALRVAAANARINGLHERLQLVRAAPDGLRGAWPLVFANVVSAAIIDMAPDLVRCVSRRGALILSGIRCTLEADVHQAYCRLGMRRLGGRSRRGWSALTLRASW
jgi:ribosomal protein L11 methyltransferase